jgi:hypothetical protein
MAPRSRDWIYLAGIIGVPWQDIADPVSLTGPGLRYLSASELSASKRWETVLGDPSHNVAPSDPFMRESVEPRSGKNPVTGDAIQPPESMDPQASPINGHEQANVEKNDLQYACTFKLEMPTSCADHDCDCTPEDGGTTARSTPLCQPPSGGPAGATQYFGKAYPGLRELEVLKGIGDSAIVASICPKVLTQGALGYGYEPAVDAIVDRLKIPLNGRCLPRPLAATADAGGALPCVVVEASPPQGTCDCGAFRQPANSEAQKLVREQLAALQSCGTAKTPSCDSFCMCELEQAEGPALSQCLNDLGESNTPGYCYVDPYGTNPQGNPALVAGCDPSRRRLIRFVGPDTPRSGSTAFIACLGATLH